MRELCITRCVKPHHVIDDFLSHLGDPGQPETKDRSPQCTVFCGELKQRESAYLSKRAVYRSSTVVGYCFKPFGLLLLLRWRLVGVDVAGDGHQNLFGMVTQVSL
jgi:hypothetical protein